MGGRTSQSSGFREGQKVEARYKGKSRYYPGRIATGNRDGTYDIDYDDGEQERSIDADLIRALEEPESMGRTSRRSVFREGQKVEERYKGKSRYYPGRIGRVKRDGTYDMDYDDGEKEMGVSEALIKES